MKHALLACTLEQIYTFKLCYSELLLITIRFKCLVGSGYILAVVFPVIAYQNSVITNMFSYSKTILPSFHLIIPFFWNKVMVKTFFNFIFH